MKNSFIEKLKKEYTGKKWPAWWEPSGEATIIEVKEYTGKYKNLIACVFKLTASRIDKGHIETSVEYIDITNKLLYENILSKAKSVFGSKSKALSWIKSSSLALGGKSPNELLKENEYEIVIDELNRIEYGIYS